MPGVLAAHAQPKGAGIDMSPYYQDREAIPHEARERELFSRLPGALARARAGAPAIARQLQDLEPARMTSRSHLAGIPVVRKSDLLQAHIEARQQDPESATPHWKQVFGGFSTIGWGEALRVFASPGPIYEPESRRSDYWGFARALY